MRGVGTSVPDRFSDPLSAALPDGGARARLRLRLAGALLFAAGALTMTAVLAAPDPDVSDHPALTSCAVVYALIAAILLAWRNAPTAVLHAICPAGTLGVPPRWPSPSRSGRRPSSTCGRCWSGLLPGVSGMWVET